MAVDDHFPAMTPSLPISALSSSSSLGSRRQGLLHGATYNSSSFIQFPTSQRQPSIFVPSYRPRTSNSSTRPSFLTIESESLSDQSKLSFSSANDSHRRCQSQRRFNPILQNPLLNHRKESPKSLPAKNSTNFSLTTRLCLSSKPLKAVQTEELMRPNTDPLLDQQTENFIKTSDKLSTPDDDQKEIESVDEIEFDYITRWLNTVRLSTRSTKTKRSKKRTVLC